MTSSVVLISIVFIAASVLSYSDQAAAFIPHSVDFTTKTIYQTNLNMAMNGGRERSSTSSEQTYNPDILLRSTNNRRSFISKLATACLTTSGTINVPAFAAETSSDDSPTLFTRIGKGYEYSFLPPSGFKSNNKPLKTHLDEINFSLEGIRGYQYGITVDPVRIESLKQFGTPDQVATRVVDAEAARDGVTDVELVGTPTEDPNTGLYLIDYISTGSRGIKHFVTRIAVKKGYLYVLTAQVKQDNFKEYEKELLDTVKTFQVP